MDSLSIMKEFLKRGIPSILCFLILFVQHAVSMMIAGHLKDSSLIAAIGMGNTIYNTIFIAAYIGMNSALETLAS